LFSQIKLISGAFPFQISTRFGAFSRSRPIKKNKIT